MKWFSKKLIIFYIFTLGSNITAFSAINILTNGDFSQGATGWNIENSNVGGNPTAPITLAGGKQVFQLNGNPAPMDSYTTQTFTLALGPHHFRNNRIH